MAVLCLEDHGVRYPVLGHPALHFQGSLGTSFFPT